MAKLSETHLLLQVDSTSSVIYPLLGVQCRDILEKNFGWALAILCSLGPCIGSLMHVGKFHEKDLKS